MRRIGIGRLVMAIFLFAFLMNLGALRTEAAYPEKPLNLLVGFAAGGLPDLMARSVAEAAKPFLPQPIAVVSKPGGTGAIAAAEVIGAAPDGYTIGIFYGPTISVVPNISKPPYKGPSDLQPVIGVVQAPVYVVVKGDSPWKTAKEMLDQAKANPGKIRVGTSGSGSIGHIVLEQLNQTVKINLTHVPFQGAARGVAAVLGGHIEAILANAGSVTGQLRAGKVKLLAVFEPKRVQGFPAIPDVPTFRELGYPVIARSSHYYIAAPRGTSKEVIQTLENSLRKAMNAESFKKFLIDNGLLADPKNPSELSQEMESDYKFMAEFLKTVKME